ncbi:MAG: hypothetical protein AAF390_15725 [Pseudomonadota bacterium]
MSLRTARRRLRMALSSRRRAPLSDHLRRDLGLPEPAVRAHAFAHVLDRTAW